MMNSALSDRRMMNDRQSDKEFLIKIYDNSLLVVCDKEILNKEFRTIKFDKRFYNGDLVSREDVLEYIKYFNNINLFGKKIVGFLVEKGFVNNFVEIEGEKFAIIVKITR